MKLTNRVQRLEQNEALAGPLLLLDQFQRAQDAAAFRLTGKDFNTALAEESESAVQRIMDDVQESFVQKLSDEDLESLTAEVERIAFGEDTAALEAARRKARDSATWLEGMNTDEQSKQS